METGELAESQDRVETPEGRHDDTVAPDNGAESPEAESQTEPETHPENSHPRSAIEENPGYVSLQRIITEEPDDGTNIAPTKEDTTQDSENLKRTWKQRSNIFQRLWDSITDCGMSPGEKTLSFLPSCLKDEDWNDRGDTTDGDAENFLEEWSQKVKAWNLSPEAARTLGEKIGNKDNKGKNRMILREMSQALSRAYPDGGRDKGEKGKTREESIPERMERINNETLTVKNRPDFDPIQAAWKKVKDVEPGELLKGQSTDTNEKMRIEGAIDGAINILMPAVIMLTKSQITSQIIVILALLSGAMGKLDYPGDTMKIGGVKAGLHEDETGHRLLSVLWEREATELNYQTEVTNFSEFADMERKMELLTKNIELMDNSTTGPPEDKMTRRHCDCILNTDYPNTTWVLPHEESYGNLCSTETKSQGNMYKVTVRATEQGPECTISPTKETRSKIEGEYNTTSNDLVDALNFNRRHPCITKGGYNLNKIPREDVMEKIEQTLIECILHCTFSTSCTDWMFHEKTKKCWILSITRKYQFAETRDHEAQLYTGQRSCTPCGLAARIVLPNHDRNMWENRCTLTLDDEQENPLRCPCNATATYKSNLDKLKASVARNKRNNIRKTSYKTVMADLNHAMKNALEEQSSQLIWDYMAKLQTPRSTIQPQETDSALRTLDPSGGLARLFSKAIKTTIKLTNKSKGKSRGNPGRSTNDANRKVTRNLNGLLEGKLQTNGAIKEGLEILQNTLETAATRKKYAFQGAQTEELEGVNKEKKAIAIAADWGAEVTRTTLTRMGLGRTESTATICPIPTSVDKRYKEGPALEGTLRITTTDMGTSWKRKCFDQISRNDRQLTSCNPGGQQKDWREVLEIRIPTKDGPLTLLRLASKTLEPTSYILDCDDNLSTISTSGLIIALIEAGCEVKTAQGRRIVKRAANPWTKKTRYWILHRTEVAWNLTQEQSTDIWHSVLIALTLTALLTEAGRRIVKKYRKIREPLHANPQQGSPERST